MNGTIPAPPPVTSVDGKTGDVRVVPRALYAPYTENDFLRLGGYSTPGTSEKYVGFWGYKDGESCGIVYVRNDGMLYTYDKDGANMAAVYTTKFPPPQAAAVNALMEGINDA